MLWGLTWAVRFIKDDRDGSACVHAEGQRRRARTVPTAMRISINTGIVIGVLLVNM